LRKAADQAGLTAGLSAALQRAGKFAAVRSWDRAGVDGGRVVVSVLAATGHTNDELKMHLRGALNLGWTVDELREALLQISGYAGFPAAHEALDVLNEIVTQG